MKKLLYYSVIALTLTAYAWTLRFNTLGVKATANLSNRQCYQLNPNGKIRFEAIPYSRILRLKGHLPDKATVESGSTVLKSPRFLKTKGSMHYFAVPPGQAGYFQVVPTLADSVEACTWEYFTSSKNNYLIVFSDFPSQSAKIGTAVNIFSALSAALIFFLSRRRSPAATAMFLLPSAVIFFAAAIIPRYFGLKVYLAIPLFIKLAGLPALAALAWQLGGDAKKLLHFLLHRENWHPPGIIESWLWGIGIVAATALAYWPSFGHLFRHDEWFYHFTFRGGTHPLLKYIDWQLFLPSDLLIFRPLHHGMLALHMLAFGQDYGKPHILSFLKHLLSSALVFALLWRLHPHRLAFLFTALFALLATQFDPVAWPHVDAYILTAVFTLGAALLFLQTSEGHHNPYTGFALAAALLLAAMLTTELAFPAPFIFFAAYWLGFRGSGEHTAVRDRAAWFFLVPFIAWLALFSLHISHIYPNFTMSAQSSQLLLFKSFYNGLTCFFLTLGRVFPLFCKTFSADKVYIASNLYWYITATALLCAAVVRYKDRLFMSREEIFYWVLALAPWLTVAVARSSYINALLTEMLPQLWVPTHYAYMGNAFMIPALYALLWRPMSARPRISAAILVVICALHGILVHSSAIRVERELAPFKSQYDQLANFVGSHKAEPNFSFKLVKRRDISAPFNWYSSSAPETFHGVFINNISPLYIVEYDYKTGILHWSKAPAYPKPEPSLSWELGLASRKPDFIDSFGMRFTRVPIGTGAVYAGVSEVTREEWAKVMGLRPPPKSEFGLPASDISWLQAGDFIRRLNSAAGTSTYRLPTAKERDAMAILTQNLAPANMRAGRAAPKPGAATVCAWLSDSITTETYTSEGTPRLCSGLQFREHGKSEIYSAGYPRDYSFSDTGLRIVKDIGR